MDTARACLLGFGGVGGYARGMDPRHAQIAALHRAGQSVRTIAELVGLSKSRVHVIVSELPDDDLDELDRDELDELDDPDTLALFDTDEDRWPPEPFAFVGYERQYFERGAGCGGYWDDVPRWVDGEGHSIGSEHESCEMALYRYRCYVAYELGEHERADALAADWTRQVAEYEARAKP